MRVRVGYHGRCFDGCCSAALFTRFYKEKFQKDAEVLYRPLAHQKGLVLGEEELDGDENVVVDFKYTSHPKLTWWFDHHQSAFNTPEQRAHFEADKGGQKFFDPHCSSCTKLINDTVREKFNHSFPDLAELIHWADIIDAARFDSAAMAVELKEPALRLMTVIEASSDEFCTSLIPQLAERGLDVARSDMVQERFKPLFDDHQRTVERIRQKATYADGVVQFDLTEWPMDGFNKFIGYYVHPEATYSVGITGSDRRSKVSVGSNPWGQQNRRHDIAKLCEKYGGGGHPAVGAVTLGAGELNEAKRIGDEIAETLRN